MRATPAVMTCRRKRGRLAYTILCATGLAAEAKIARAAGLSAVVGAGDHHRTVRIVEQAAPAAECLVSFGIAGGLSPDLKPGDIVLSSEVIDGDRRWVGGDSLRAQIDELVGRIGAVEGAVLGAQTVIAGERDKRRAWQETGAIAVDLESAAVARAGAALGIPFIVLRAIADPAARDLPPAALAPLRDDGTPSLGRVVRSVMRRPRQLPTLFAVAREARQALAALVDPAHALRSVLGGAGSPAG